MEDIEPSIEAYGLASILKKNINNIIRVNIFILSNGDIPHDPPNNFKLKGLEDILISFKIWDIERLHRLARSTCFVSYNNKQKETYLRQNFQNHLEAKLLESQ